MFYTGSVLKFPARKLQNKTQCINITIPYKIRVLFFFCIWLLAEFNFFFFFTKHTSIIFHNNE